MLFDIWENHAKNEIAKYGEQSIQKDIIHYLLDNPPKSGRLEDDFLKRALKLLLAVITPADPEPELLLPMPTSIRHLKNTSLRRTHTKLVKDAMVIFPSSRRKFQTLLVTMKNEIDESWNLMVNE